jgi:hypothetical protein
LDWIERIESRFPKHLENAQEAEFAVLTRYHENILEERTSNAVKYSSLLSYPKALISYNSLKIGQYLTQAHSKETLIGKMEGELTKAINLYESQLSWYNASSPTIWNNDIYLIRCNKELDRISTSSNPQKINNLTSDNKINDKLNRLAKKTAEQSHNFQKNVGFWIPMGLGVIGISAGVIALKNRNR